MASPSTSSAPAIPPKYEYLKSLCDIQTIRDLTEDAVRDILRNKTNDHGLEVVEMGQISDMSGLNDAFNSTICSLKVKAKFSGKGPSAAAAGEGEGEGGGGAAGEEKEFNFVIKSPPKTTFMKQLHKLSRPFFNEVSFYLELMHQLTLAEQTDSPSPLERILPVCYHAHSSYYANHEGTGTCCTRNFPWFCWLPCKSAESGVIVLENVKNRDGRSFNMFDKRKPLPLDHITLVFKELARFHGKWLVWISKAKAGTLRKDAGIEPISYNSFIQTYNTQKRIPVMMYKQLAKIAKKTTTKILRKRGGPKTDEYVEKCVRFFERSSLPRMKTYLNTPPGPLHTLTHGDFWSNNIMFAYDDEGTVKDLIIIDYQLVNYGHPAYDLVYFVYLNTDQQFRDAHLKDVLRTYYDTLSPYVEEAHPAGATSEGGKEADGCFKYSFEDFVEDFNYHRPLGFATACAVMPNVMSSAQVDLEQGLFALRELQRKQAAELDDDENPSSIEIRRRIVDMVEEMARDGVI